MPPTATQAELKKQFYVLSKETHPDLHPNDPKASERFSQISESYSILADPEKRKRYDRDFLRNPNLATGSQRGYAGSRAPTGLSKRRGAFRGPPPSYYTHGNPSANTTRQSAESNSSSSSSSFSSSQYRSSSEYQGGMFNASAFAPEGQYDPAFDPRPIHKTQTHEDIRRNSRRAAEIAAAQAHAEEESDFWVRFVVVTTVVLLGVTGAGVFAGLANTPRGGLTRSDGSSRREGGRDLNHV